MNGTVGPTGPKGDPGTGGGGITKGSLYTPTPTYTNGTLLASGQYGAITWTCTSPKDVMVTGSCTVGDTGHGWIRSMGAGNNNIDTIPAYWECQFVNADGAGSGTFVSITGDAWCLKAP